MYSILNFAFHSNIMIIMKNLFIPPAVVLYSVIFIILFYLFLKQFNIIPFPYNLGGIIITFVGFTIMGKSRDLFNKYKTTLGFDKSSYLIDEGIFSKTRNPMYIGMFLLLLGIALCFRNLFSVLIPFLFIFITMIAYIPKEEKLMQESFGQKYIEYKERVKRWF